MYQKPGQGKKHITRFQEISMCIQYVSYIYSMTFVYILMCRYRYHLFINADRNLHSVVFIDMEASRFWGRGSCAHGREDGRGWPLDKMNIDDICRLPSLKPTSSHLKMEGCWNTIVSFLGVCLFSGATLLLVLGSVTTITSEIQLLDTKNVPTKKRKDQIGLPRFPGFKMCDAPCWAGRDQGANPSSFEEFGGLQQLGQISTATGCYFYWDVQ